MKKLLIVKGMHCKSCEMLIKDSLEETGHVRSAQVSHKDGKLEVDYDENKIDESRLRQIVKAEGYEVE